MRLLFRLQEYLKELGGESEYPYFDLYWRERGRYAYWIKVSGCIAGFALVRRSATGVTEIAEFSVDEPWRRRGVGQIAARALFDAHPGSWQVQSFPLDGASEAFWMKAVPPDAQRVKNETNSVFLFDVGAAV